MVTTKRAGQLLLLCLLAAPYQAHSFVNHRSLVNRLRRTTDSKIQELQDKQKLASPLNIPRGGDTELNMATGPVLDLLYPMLQSGPYGVLGLTAVAATAVVPLTIYKQMYSISVGYGAAIFLIGLCLQLAFQPVNLGTAFTGALMFYGIRLSSYLFLREKTRKSPANSGSKQSPILKRLPLALSVSFFYAFLTTPALYFLRNMATLSSNKLLITEIGIGLAFFGAVLEAVGDLQKYIVKQSADSSDQFVGPTTGAYQLCRHPNYLGEILFWSGVFVGGAASFGTSIIAWVASALGLYGTLLLCYLTIVFVR